MFNTIKNTTWSILTNKYILYFLLIIIVGVSIYLIYKSMNNKYGVKYSENNEGAQQQEGLSSNEAEIMLFSADWCPHCKAARPEWEQVRDEYKNKTINGYSIIFTDINCTTPTAEIEKVMNQFKVEGYPTIKLLKDGQVVDFDAKPTKSSITQFLNSVL